MRHRYLLRRPRSGYRYGHRLPRAGRSRAIDSPFRSSRTRRKLSVQSWRCGKAIPIPGGTDRSMLLKARCHAATSDRDTSLLFLTRSGFRWECAPKAGRLSRNCKLTPRESRARRTVFLRREKTPWLIQDPPKQHSLAAFRHNRMAGDIVETLGFGQVDRN